MKLLLALALVTASLAFLPTADACSGSGCVPNKDVRVCVEGVVCQTYNARDIYEGLTGPCTCPPL